MNNNNMYLVLRNLMGVILILTSISSIAQQTFEELFSTGISNTRGNTLLAKQCFTKMTEIENLTEVQKAKLNYLKVKVNLEVQEDVKIETLKPVSYDHLFDDSMLNKAIYFIDHSYVDKGLDILYRYLEDNKESIHDTLSGFLQLKIVEGLRINTEYEKGISIVRNVLRNPHLSDYNKAYAYNRLASLFDQYPLLKSNQRIDSVIKYSELSMHLSELKDFKSILASSQNELASIYKLSSFDLERSEYYALEARKNFLELKMYRNVMNISIILSDIHLRKKEISKAPLPCYQALQYIDIIGNEDMFMRIYLQLAKSNYLLGEYEDAYEFLSIGRLLEKILFKYSMNDKINEMSAKYNLSIKESEINRIKIQVEAQKNKNWFLIIITITITLLLIAIFILFFIIRGNLKQKNKIAQIENENLALLFENKNKELMHSLAHNIEYTKNLKRIRRKLKEHKIDNEIIKIINTDIYSSQTTKKILFDYYQLYPLFLSQLNVKHPDLSDNEKQLCTLLALNLTTNEIANTISISSLSVSKNRQRLRKRLDLLEKTPLHDYLVKFTIKQG